MLAESRAISRRSKSCRALKRLVVAQFTFLLDDIGIPKDYRHMDGAGVHTFKLVNKAGRDTYVKFHWKTKQGAPSCVFVMALST